MKQMHSKKSNQFQNSKSKRTSVCQIKRLGWKEYRIRFGYIKSYQSIAQYTSTPGFCMCSKLLESMFALVLSN